jgi:hypothetical protein
MRRFGFLLLGTLLLAAASAASVQAGAPCAPPPCEPGYVVVPETCYREVVVKRCKVVPDVRKVSKWVYSCVEEDFCLPKCGHPKLELPFKKGCNACDGCAPASCDSCGPCVTCEKPRCKKKLVKREVITEEHYLKCVVEHVVEQVPYTTYRKVPCGHAGAPVLTPAPGAMPAPTPAPVPVAK